MNRDKRLKRFASFKEFYEECKLIFTEFLKNDSHAQALDREYSFYVSPGSSAGGTNTKIVEIHFGKRMLRSHKTPTGFNSDAEEGGSLIYESLDNGYVVVIIYPATAKNVKRLEDGIVLNSNLNSRDLKNRRILKRHWRAFIAYMEISGIDGAPSLYQRLLIKYILFTRPLIKNNVAQDTKRKAAMKWAINFLLLTGCSGFVYAIVSEVRSHEKTPPIEHNSTIDSARLYKITDTIGSNVSLRQEKNNPPPR